MKTTCLITLGVTTVSALILTSCAVNRPLASTGGHNPLDAAGSGVTEGTSEVEQQDQNYRPGTFLQTTSPSTPLFAKFPKSSDQPISAIPDFAEVKVISTKGR